MGAEVSETKELTNLQMKIAMAELAIKGEEPTPAFYACCKLGMTNVKRPAFEEEYAKMLASPLLRVLAVRTAREDEFRMLLSALCLKAAPPEDKVARLSGLFTHAKENPSYIEPCLKEFAPYVDEKELARVQKYHDTLWPKADAVETEKPKVK